MGIEFTGFADDAKQRFQDHLNKVDPGISVKVLGASE
jgi:hypothetical protein